MEKLPRLTWEPSYSYHVEVILSSPRKKVHLSPMGREGSPLRRIKRGRRTGINFLKE